MPLLGAEIPNKGVGADNTDYVIVIAFFVGPRAACSSYLVLTVLTGNDIGDLWAPPVQTSGYQRLCRYLVTPIPAGLSGA